jgi:hypothetical protein
MDFNTHEYLTVKEFCKQYSFISEGQLRWILFNRQENDATKFLRRLGKRRILIHVPSFFDWLDNEGGINE